MDILFSIILTAFGIYCFWLVGAQSPAATATELGAAFWPRIVLGLMIILLIANTIQIYKKMKADNTKVTDGIDIKGFFTSKLFIGMVIVAVMAFLMPIIGFMPTCLLFLMAYGYLLGERNILRLFLFSLLITIILYVLFQIGLSIMLARGVGIFRSFAIFCETLLMF